jgi:hypothetical protein
MNIKGWRGFAGVAILSAGLLLSGQLRAAAVLSDGYTLEDFKLLTAADLVDVCTVEYGHPHYDTARAFCYGFFEGGAHYHNTISASPSYKKIVCPPPETTRTDAVEVFVTYIQGNPEYASEEPIDAIFRALVAKWPCDD